MAKKKNGYDPTNPKNRPSDEEKAVHDEWRRAQREPYDPLQEQVMETIGSVNADRNGNAKIFVEIVSYKGTGPWRVKLTKRGTSVSGAPFTTPNLGTLYPNVVDALIIFLESAQLSCTEQEKKRLAERAASPRRY